LGGPGAMASEADVVLLSSSKALSADRRRRKKNSPAGSENSKMLLKGPLNKTCSDGGGEKKTGRGPPVPLFFGDQQVLARKTSAKCHWGPLPKVKAAIR